MPVRTVWGAQSGKNEILTKEFVELINKSCSDMNGTAYLSYPFLTEGNNSIDALLLLENKTPIAVAFDGSENDIDKNKLEYQLDDYFITLESKFKKDPDLQNRRKLKFDIKTIAYCPNISSSSDSLGNNSKDVDYVTSGVSLSDVINKREYDFQYENNMFSKVESVLLSLTTLSKVGDEQYTNGKEGNLFSRIKSIQGNIVTFDQKQKKVAIETYDGVQRIRGLAGTGKTIVLAWKAAYLHIVNPNWDIAVTFYSRSLKKMYKYYIEKFCMELSGKIPNFDKIHIVNSWGGQKDAPKELGLYYHFCMSNDITPLTFKEADSFDEACKRVLATKRVFQEKYDVILIDESQDLPESFLKMAYKFIRKPKRLIFAYDDWQNLGNSTLPSIREIFGKNVRAGADTYGRNPDLILDVCYRTPRPILVVAHALGCGIYRKKGFVQMLSPATYWNKLGYKNETTRLEKGSRAALSRDSDTSPKYLESISTRDDFSDILDFSIFSDRIAMSNQIFAKIKYYLDNGIPAEEIMVIVPSPANITSQISNITQKLIENNIAYNIAGFDNANIFEIPETITFTGIHRAKGNEALVVFLMSADVCEKHHNAVLGRNILFTSMTRTHCFMHVYGCGEKMQTLIDEKNKVIEDEFALKFKYPTSKEIEKFHQVGDIDDNTEQAKSRKLIAEFEKLKYHEQKDLMDNIGKGDSKVA